MNLIEIGAIPQNVLKLFKRASSFGTPVLIRRQVAGDDVRAYIWKSGHGINGISAWRIRWWLGAIRKPSHGNTWRHSLAKIGAAGKVGGGVGFCRPLVQKVGVPAVGVI